MHTISKHFMMLLTAGSCFLALTTERSHAAAMLTLFDGTTTVSILDGSGMDMNATPGVIVFNGVLGVWDINVSTGLTKPVIGSPSDPHMDLNSIDHSTGSGFLRITFTDTGFIATPGTITAGIGGTQQNGSVRFTAYQNLSLLTDSGTLSGTPFTAASSAPLSGLTPYSLTEEVIINHTAAGVTSWDATLDVTLVPEGDTMFAMAGLAVVAGALTLRRKLSPA